MAKKKPKEPARRTINIWAMIRDVLIASINKGQLLIAGVILFILILAVKMPSEQTGELLKKIFDSLISGYILGYILFVASVFGWFVHVKIQRRTFHDEIRRVGDEKTELQKKILPKLIESSEV